MSTEASELLRHGFETLSESLGPCASSSGASFLFDGIPFKALDFDPVNGGDADLWSASRGPDFVFEIVAWYDQAAFLNGAPKQGDTITIGTSKFIVEYSVRTPSSPYLSIALKLAPEFTGSH